MSFLGIFKKKTKPEAKELVFPSAPGTEEFPSFPTPEEVLGKKITPPAKPKIDIESFEKTTVKAQEKELSKMEEHAEVKRPVFVRVELFKDILDELSISKSITKESEDILARISEFKQDEDKEFNKWQSQVYDIQRKLIYVDKVLFANLQ